MSNLIAGFIVATSVIVPQNFNGHTQSIQGVDTHPTQSIHKLSIEKGKLQSTLHESKTKTETGDSTPKRGDSRRE